MELTTIFYHADEFCNFFEKEFEIRVLSDGEGLRKKEGFLRLSEVMTIVIYYHRSGYKTFKDYYTRSTEIKGAFRVMPSYNRFIELQQKALLPMAIFAKILSSGKCDGISFVDSFPLRVSHHKRASSHKTFRGLAAKGKTSIGWFYGFKLHVIINGNGELLDFLITPGNIADNNTKLIEKMMFRINGKVYGDKGYLLNPDLFKKLFNQGVHLVTKIRNNMANKLMDIGDKFMLKKRAVVESVGAVLKEDLNIEHSRYRSPMTLFLNVFSALIGYSLGQHKPSIYRNKFDLLTA